MAEHFADRLTAAVRAKRTCACVGIDPVYERLPEAVRREFPRTHAVAGIRAFCRGVLDAVHDLVAVVKFNVAFFESFRGPGFDQYFELVAYARSLGLIVIGDVKRGDIGHTSTAYARAHLTDSDAGLGPDAVTLSGYFGIDGIQPFLDVCQQQGKGLFILVHTSNASAGQMQHAELADGTNVAERMAGLVNDWAHGEGMIGRCGLSAVGAVVASDEAARARVLRRHMPDSIFLVPGFGAQGRSLEQVAACFRADGSGAVVNSSRGVINAYEEPQYVPPSPEHWPESVRRACRDLVDGVSKMRASGHNP